MASPQRWSLIIGAVITAIVMHIAVCQWHVGTDVSFRVPVIIGWRADPEGVTRGEGATYGIVAKADQPYPQIFGLLVPFALLTLAAFLFFGGIPAARMRRGACPQCGQNLQFKFDAGCPECGWRRA